MGFLRRRAPQVRLNVGDSAARPRANVGIRGRLWPSRRRGLASGRATGGFIGRGCAHLPLQRRPVHGFRLPRPQMGGRGGRRYDHAPARQAPVRVGRQRACIVAGRRGHAGAASQWGRKRGPRAKSCTISVDNFVQKPVCGCRKASIGAVSDSLMKTLAEK